MFIPNVRIQDAEQCIYGIHSVKGRRAPQNGIMLRTDIVLLVVVRRIIIVSFDLLLLW